MEEIDNSVTFRLSMGSEDYEKIKNVLPSKVFEDVETRRELAVMKEVLAHEGGSISEKIDATLDDWSSRKKTKKEEITRYKIRHR